MNLINSNNLIDNIRELILNSRTKVLTFVNKTLIETYWSIGKMIVEDIKKNKRAEYGEQLIENIAIQLTNEFGKGFTSKNLYAFCKFYNYFPIFHSLRGKLSRTHYRLLIRLDDKRVRDYYYNESIENQWSSRELERQMRTLSYHRRLSVSKKKDSRIKEQDKKESNVEYNPKMIIKDPYILEFLGFDENSAYKEKDLECGLITQLSKFLLELGKGFCFVARQKCIVYENDQYFIDLVFYNSILKCYVVIDLKVGKITHQSLGQIDFYRNYYDYEVKRDDDNPTIGLLLVTENDNFIAKYSSVYKNDKIYVSKYMTYMPSEEELKELINKEKQIIEEYKLLENEKEKDFKNF